MRGVLRHICSTWRGRLALSWLCVITILAFISLFAFSLDHRATAFDTSLLPPGSHEGAGLTRSIIAEAIVEPTTQRITTESLQAAVNEFMPLSHSMLDQLGGAVLQLEPGTLGRDEAERFVSSHIGQLDHHQRFGFLLGTDALGNDVLAQLVQGCHTALLVGIVAAGIALVLGVLIGMAMGLGGRWIDSALLRLTEAVMSVPLLYVLVLAAGLLPRNTLVVMAIIGCLSWHGAARYVRAECMKLRNADFVQSARAAGAPLPRMALRHILPNAAAPVIVDTSFAIAGAILVEATLSFLGLGANDRASWGTLMRDATEGGAGFNWWLGVFPGSMIFCTALSLVLLGESLRDSLDPRSRETGARAWTYTARA